MSDKTEQVSREELDQLKKELASLKSQTKKPYTRIYCDVAVLDDCTIWICNSLMPDSDKALSNVNFEDRWTTSEELPEDQVMPANWCNGLMTAIYAGLGTMIVGEGGSRVYIQHRDEWFAEQMLKRENPFTKGSKLYEKFENIIEILSKIKQPVIFQLSDEDDKNWQHTFKRLYYEVVQYRKWKEENELQSNQDRDNQGESEVHGEET